MVVYKSTSFYKQIMWIEIIQHKISKLNNESMDSYLLATATQIYVHEFAFVGDPKTKINQGTLNNV